LCKGKTRLGIYFKVKEANHLEVISFLKILRKACDEDEKMHLRHLKLRNFMRIQILKKTKNNSLMFLKLYIMNLKIL